MKQICLPLITVKSELDVNQLQENIAEIEKVSAILYDCHKPELIWMAGNQKIKILYRTVITGK